MKSIFAERKARSSCGNPLLRVRLEGVPKGSRTGVTLERLPRFQIGQR